MTRFCLSFFSLWVTNYFSEQYSQNSLQITGVLAGGGVAECSLCKFNEIKTVHGECCSESGLAWRVPLLQVHRSCFFQCFFSSAHSKSSLLRFPYPFVWLLRVFSCWYLHFHKHYYTQGCKRRLMEFCILIYIHFFLFWVMITEQSTQDMSETFSSHSRHSDNSHNNNKFVACWPTYSL